MADAKIPLTFRIFKGDTLVREETLTQPVIKVGKLSSSHLRLEDDSVSRMHAVIEVTGPGDVSIIDLGSTKGTFVNGQKVNKAKLQSGDLVTLGETRIEVTVGTEMAGAADDDPTQVQMAAAPEAEVLVQSPQSVAPPRMAAPAPPMAAPAPPMAAPAPPMAAPQQFAPPPTPRAAPAAPPPPGVVAPPGMFGAPTAPAPLGFDSGDDFSGARAIEVAAMLGDSVVGVKHVMNPKGGKVSPLTYILFAIGAASLLMAGIAFSKAVSNATLNKTAAHYHTEELKLPFHEFRPHRISIAYDWMAFGGIISALVCFTTGLVRLRNERVQPYFRIGRSPDVDFATDGHTPLASFPLVAPLGDDFVLNFVDGMEGELMVEGQPVTPLGELQGKGLARPSMTAAGALEMGIPQKARIRVKSGHNTFLVSSVPQPRRQPVPLFATMSTTALAFFAGSAIVHLGFWALLRTIPPDPQTLALDLGSGEGRVTHVQAKPEETPIEEEEEKLDEDDGEEEGGTGTKMALEEGKMGKEDSEREAGQFALENKHVDPQLARQTAMDKARTSGIAGALQGDTFASLTGTADFSSGLDDRTVYGGLVGDEVGEMKGGFGFGVSGFGPGGGGTGWGTIGAGRYGTIGHGSGTGTGYGTGSGRGGMRGRRSVTPNVRIGNATATGDLDKNIIRRYIRRKLPRIKYCYEKQLLVKPGLEGTVVTNFQISPTGAVLSTQASGVNKEVSDCVAEVISSIQFPKPKGGGLVQVRYPFNFRPTGG